MRLIIKFNLLKDCKYEEIGGFPVAGSWKSFDQKKIWKFIWRRENLFLILIFIKIRK